jgi:hypothetical protein
MRSGLFRPYILIGLAAGTLRAQSAGFESGLYPVMEKVGCRACHSADGVASGTRLHFPETDATPAKIEAFGRSLVTLVDREHPELSLLLRKPTARIPHSGGERIKPGSQEEALLKAWIDRLSRLSGDEFSAALRYRELEDNGGGAVASNPQLRRLTHSQFNHTIRDLLGDQTAPANQFPPEDFVNGFRNQSRGQSMSPLLVEAYSGVAERLARSAFVRGDVHGLIPCKPSAACRSRFVREFGLKTFRRPLDAAEQKRYAALMARETDFLKGAQLVLEAMLQSPNFLFRLDATSDPRLKPWATASRLSYGLWDTMPDAELFAASARGDLSTPEGVEKQARRMLTDGRARESLNEFVSQWLRFDRLLTAGKDRRKFPLYTRETSNAMTQEALNFVSDLVWNNGNFMTLFTADYGYVSPELAGIYGVAAPGREFDRVPFPAGSGRAGILGQGLFLALTSKPEESSPTARGLFVREQFLCQHVPDPPPGVNTNLPPVTEAKPQTNRDRMTEHATNPSCATCHRLIDPIGFGLEKFDAVGARRENLVLEFGGFDEEGRPRGPVKTVALDIDSTGNVARIPDSRFSSPAQLGSVLAKSGQCQECVVKQYFRYTVGREDTPADRPLIRKAFEEFRNSQFRFQQLIVSITLLREFPDREEAAHAADNYKSR